jgi:hypothetical protein
MERTLLEFHQTEEIQAALDLKHARKMGKKKKFL